jgi:hypothetical protein
VSIGIYRNCVSGPVALLGNGPSLNGWDLKPLARTMPLLGINSSWRKIHTPWACYICPKQHLALLRGDVSDPPSTVFFLDSAEGEYEEIPKWSGIEVPVPQATGDQDRFRGFELSLGSYGRRAGYFALELAAWFGFDPIYLVAYDEGTGHFHDNKRRIPFNFHQELWERAAQQIAAAGLTVINTNRDSLIRCFQFGDPPQEEFA